LCQQSENKLNIPCVCLKYPTNAGYELSKMEHRVSAYKNEIVQSNTICPDNNKLKQNINYSVNLYYFHKVKISLIYHQSAGCKKNSKKISINYN